MFLEVIRFGFEFDILEWFYRIGSPFLNVVAYILSLFGESLVILPLLTFIYWCVDKEKGKKIAFVGIVGFNINNLIKGLFYAKRPFQYEGYEHLRKLDEAKDAATGASFPSGHSQSTGTMGTAIFASFKNTAVRIICVIMMILVPISRLYLGVHFPGDVVIGLLLGILSVPLFCMLYEKTEKKNILYLIIGVALLIGVVLNLKENCKDYYKCFGLFIGLAVAFNIEEKFVNFKMIKGNPVKNLLRFLLGIACVGILYLASHFLNHVGAIESNLVALYICCFVTHAILAFAAIAGVPFLFTKIKYLSE